MMTALQLLPYLLVAAIAAAAVLHHCFDDSLTQRVGLSGVCIGASLKAYSIASNAPANDACMVLVYGLAVYGIGTIIKLRKASKP
jgi:hypothetical protein